MRCAPMGLLRLSLPCRSREGLTGRLFSRCKEGQVQGPSRLLPSWGVVLALALVGAFSAAPASAKLPRGYQVTRVDGPDPQSEYRLGDAIVNAGGDIDGDGPDDLLVGIARGGSVKGRVLVLNGVDGSVISEIPAPSDDADG